VTLLPSGVNRRCGLNTAKSVAYSGLISPNRTGVLVGLTSFALTANPVPGVEYTAPRGELELKNPAGNWFGEENVSGTASQLISRRPEPTVPATFGFSPPRSAWN